MHTRTDRLLADLDETECYRLADAEPVGRLVWTGADGLAVVPVNFTLEYGAVHIRTAAYSAIARECDGRRVAFEVDSYNTDTRTGWSVVMAGRATLDVIRPGVVPTPDPWPGGSKTVQLTVEVDKVTGRRLRQH
jgi:hypothetical protein